MPSAVDHELTLCGNAVTWLNQELAARPELCFSSAVIEQSTPGNRQRRDITIYEREDRRKIAITIEVKLPYARDGQTPFNNEVVDDAHTKASRAGARYFVTWNVNRLVIWRTDEQGKPLYDRHFYEDVLTVSVNKEADLTYPPVVEAIKKLLRKFLERAHQAYTGIIPLPKRPLDEYFITALEAALERPIAITLNAIVNEYDQNNGFKHSLESWMRDAQGWHLSDDDLLQRENLERAAKFSCYVLVNRIVFYHALRKKFDRLKVLKLPGTVQTAEDFETRMKEFFAGAMKVTRDYETVFNGDFGDRLPFLSNAGVPAWRELLESFERFDFTQINYDVIGPIFERLISPEERHRYGQHYTKAEIVDLIEAFCIRTPEAVVMDPSAGGGTFLVRAYNRKKFLAREMGKDIGHRQLLDTLYGVDVSAYAVHLTTINLATRDLIDDSNYPQVAQSDFFDVEHNQIMCHLPLGKDKRGDKELEPIYFQPLDAVVGNPPYIRQEEISKPVTSTAKGREKVKARSLEQIKAEAKKYKSHLGTLAKKAWPPIQVSGRSDIHVYFWPHATTFLKDGGYFGFLTSSGWLDVDYGFRLQDFFLHNYSIIALFESQKEPWFTGARVTTCAAILRKEPDPKKRDENIVRFVQIRSPLGEIFPANTEEVDRQRAAEKLRDRIESITQNTTEKHWRVRVVKQAELYKQGCAAPASSDDDESEEEENGQTAHKAASNGAIYHGGKWGVYLRAPDIFFDLQDRFKEAFAPIATVADVRFGLKSGCDKFFFVRDITDDILAEELTTQEFRDKYGILPVQTDKVRRVLAGDGSAHWLEAEYLEPEVHNLMETNGVFGIKLDPQQLRLKVFMCSESKAKLSKTFALKYISWGEKEGFHQTSTVKQRAQANHWYDLTGRPRGAMFWTRATQYRHCVPWNEDGLTCGCGLYDIFPNEDVDAKLLCALFNSTLIALHKHIFGRWAGTEGNLQNAKIDILSIPVPDPRRAKVAIKKKLLAAFAKMMKRPTRNLSDEFSDPARQELDDAVFELLGEKNATVRRTLRDRLYAEMTAMQAAIREKELLMNENKKSNKKGGKVSVEKLVESILESMDSSLLRKFPESFLTPDEPCDTIDLTDQKPKEEIAPLMGRVGVVSGGNYTELGDERRARLVMLLWEFGRRGPVPIPKSVVRCEELRSRFKEFREQTDAEFAHLAAQKTANEKIQAKILALLKHRLSAI